jgi:hypothetical protein
MGAFDGLSAADLLWKLNHANDLIGIGYENQSAWRFVTSLSSNCLKYGNA